jgi:hypothetical protein
MRHIGRGYRECAKLLKELEGTDTSVSSVTIRNIERRAMKKLRDYVKKEMFPSVSQFAEPDMDQYEWQCWQEYLMNLCSYENEQMAAELECIIRDSVEGNDVIRIEDE